MKKWICLFCIICLLFHPMQSLAKEEEKVSGLYAKSAVLMDADLGRVLYEKEGDVHLPNASTTKIMTCILTIESGKMEESATVSTYAASMPKVKLGMTPGDTFCIRDLLYSLMLESHNDSAVVIAEHIGNTVEDFSEMMNQKATEIGCTDTYFITPNGLDATDEKGVHGTTARDLALIMSYCIKNDTFLEITQTENYTFSNQEKTKSYTCRNHNAFLSMMDGVISGKTGFTGDAGYCYVGALRQDGRTFVVALLACGWPNHKTYKWSDTRKLMEYGLAHYAYEDVFEHGVKLVSIPVQDGRPTTWNLKQKLMVKPILEDETIFVLKRQDETVRVIYDLPEYLKAPIQSGTRIGTATYYLGEQVIKHCPIYADNSVEQKEKSWLFKYVLHLFFQM